VKCTDLISDENMTGSLNNQDAKAQSFLQRTALTCPAAAFAVPGHFRRQKSFDFSLDNRVSISSLPAFLSRKGKRRRRNSAVPPPFGGTKEKINAI